MGIHNGTKNNWFVGSLKFLTPAHTTNHQCTMLMSRKAQSNKELEPCHHMHGH